MSIPSWLVQHPPEIKTRHGAVACPAFRQNLHALWLGKFSEAKHALECLLNAEIPCRQHVRPRECKHEEHLRRPLSNPFDRRHMFDYFRISHCAKLFLVDGPVDKFSRQVLQVGSLLRRESCGT